MTLFASPATTSRMTSCSRSVKAPQLLGSFGPCLGVLLAFASFGRVATDRLVLDQLAARIEQRTVSPVFPDGVALGQVIVRCSCDDNWVFDRYRRQLAAEAHS